MEVFLLPNELPLVQAQMPDAYWRCMSETRDKRRRTDLDLFVLALIADGISTPYKLQRSASVLSQRFL